MNSLVAQQQGYNFPMDEISRTYYPGRGFLSDQEAYPENPFYRPPTYGGGMNIPGAPGNVAGTGGFIKLPYYGGPTNPMLMPYYPGQDYGGVQLLGASPSFEIPGGQTPYRRGPYLPFEDIPEDNAPFIPIPRAQGLPMGFQNKFVS